MPGLTCNACNKEFLDDSEQKLHYKSEWHRYNLKRKIAGVPGVTEALFLARQSALAEQKKKLDEAPMLYSCGLCGKGYRSSKAHAQHLKSKTHILRSTQGENLQNEDNAIIRPLTRRTPVRPPHRKVVDSEESDESEWEEADPEEEMIGEAADSLASLNMTGDTAAMADDDDEDDDDDFEELDPTCCIMCDAENGSLESCMVHMHKKHGFFIPDIEYLKDPKGLLTYLGIKVKRDFLCLYCNERCHPFSSLEAVRKHMEAKSHCKVRYGDGNDDEEVELEEFYDYSSSYMYEDGKQLVAINDGDISVELGHGGSELIIKNKTNRGVSAKTLGSREFLRYYKQKPRPAPDSDKAISIALASRYKSMGLATVHSKEHTIRMKVMKEISRSGVEVMRSKIGMKSNVIRNLPKNVPY
ncbi:cytoplasmic 60S subunit biogenesis factor REI1 homolog 1 [Amaranthus tricolor]|uniref:cytoplasmic 60S subunit biogenesis factor REI1 homolog 1 n=1 Tax=Amaranthus tricolor TaxID=29722 RepID=UPI00258A375C|nr:cytoplasmic 60S subunit biogenesis factor REI1 homolog 1 [Amaranthus tricolor]